MAQARLGELIERLAAAEVEFVVVGGLVVNAWGHLRGTRDLDIVPEPGKENLERLATVLEAPGGRVEVAEGRLGPSAIRTFLAAGDRTLVATELAPVDVLQGHAHVPSSRTSIGMQSTLTSVGSTSGSALWTPYALRSKPRTALRTATISRPWMSRTASRRCRPSRAG